MKQLALSQDLKVVIWQWPEHRVLWGKKLQRGAEVSVVAENDDGAMICHLESEHYFVLWPENTRRRRKDSLLSVRGLLRL